jgi:phage-related protein (TIGR01555 family)
MAQIRKDGYVNVLNKYGTQRDSSTAYQYESEGLIPDTDLTLHYENNGLFSKIIDRAAEECIKHGYDFDGIAEEQTKKLLQSCLDYIDFDEAVITALKWTRLYGGALIVMLADEGAEKDLTEPLNLDSVRGIDELRVFERPIVQPDYESMYRIGAEEKSMQHKHSKFGMPEFYTVYSQYGTFRVHESRCLIFRNGKLPERSSQQLYRFWGIPEYIRIKTALQESITSAGFAVKLLERSVQAVYGMKGLSDLLSRDGGEDELLKRLMTIDLARGILGSMVMDSENETYEFKTAQLAGLQEVIDSTCSMLSSVTNYPQTILFGRSPAGMNATGDADFENYYSFIEREQKTKVRSIVETVAEIILQSAKLRGIIDEVPEFQVVFNPLKTESEEQKSAAELSKAQAQQIRAQIAQSYVDMGVLDPTEVRKKLAGSDEFDIETMLDDLPEDELLQMPEQSGQQEQPEQTPAPQEEPANPNQAVPSQALDADGEQEFITVNGAAVPVDETGDLQGAVGNKIEEQAAESSEKSSEKGVASSGESGIISEQGVSPTSGVSAKGANSHLQPFTGKNLDAHFGSGGRHDHSEQYPAMTKDQYAKRAHELVISPVGGSIMGYRTASGKVVRYDKETNDFVVGFDAGVGTMFKPKRGEAYFTDLMKDEGEER